MEHPAKKANRPPRARRLSGRARLMLWLGIALIVAAAFVWLLPTIRARYPSALTDKLRAKLTYRTLEQGDVNVLDSITVSHEGGERYTLVYRDQELYLHSEGAEDVLINESYSDQIVSAATEIAVEDTVTSDAGQVSDHLKDMGLEPPRIIVQVDYANGREVTLQVGAQVPDTSYYYYRWSGDNGIYMCDTGINDAFSYTEHMLLPVEQPTLVPSLIDRVTLQTGKGETIACSFTADGTDAWLGTMQKPYQYPMDSDATAKLLGAFQNFRLGTKIGPVTAENRSEYGFDKPSAVVDAHQQKGLYSQVDATGVLQTLQTEDQTIRLRFGAMDGEFFYFCEYSGVCYRVSSFLVAAFVDASAETFLSRAPADMGSARIASVAVQLGSGALDLRASYVERVKENNQIETDANGNTVYDVSVTLNGSEIATDAFDSLVQRLAQMKVSGRLDTTDPPSGTPRWSMTLTTASGVTRTLAAYPMDAFSDVLVVDGTALHYLNDEAIRIALAELYPSAAQTTPVAN